MFAKVIDPPSDTAPPPESPVPEFTVTEEYCSCPFPIVEVETTWPVGLTARREFERPVKARLVVVAEVEVELIVVRLVIVEEALRTMPTVEVGVRKPFVRVH